MGVMNGNYRAGGGSNCLQVDSAIGILHICSISGLWHLWKYTYIYIYITNKAYNIIVFNIWIKKKLVFK